MQPTLEVSLLDLQSYILEQERSEVQYQSVDRDIA